MSPLLLALAICGAPLDDVSGPTIQTAPIPSMRRILEITREVDDLVRRETRVESDSERALVAFQMTQVYREIKRDPRLAVSESLKEAKSRLWNKLTRIKREVETNLKRAGRGGETLTDAEVLALADQEIVTQSFADHLALAGSSLGGGTFVLGHAGQVSGASGGPAGPPDYGPALVDLIQRTIVPEFWDVQGGPGTIVYFRPLMCLVVRATSDVHHRLGGTVGALRAVK